MQVQQTDVAAGGGRTAVLMAGYVSAGGLRTWSLQARLGGVRGLGPLVRLASGDVEAPQVAVGADGTAMAAWTARPQRGTEVLRVTVARPGHNFGRSQTLSQARSIALGGLGVTARGRPVVAWRLGTSAAPVQVAVAAAERPFGAAHTLGDSRQSVPAVAVAPNGTVVVTWLDTPAPPQPPPAPTPTETTARMLAATLAAGVARFSSTTELATLSFWSSDPGAASGPGGAAITWRQTPAEQRVAPLGAGDTLQASLPLNAAGPPRTRDAGLSDRLALAIPADGTTVALWLETRSGTAVVKTSTRRTGGAFSPARTLSASGWLAWQHAAMALPDRALAAWSETRGSQSRVRLAVRPVGRGWLALSPLPARSLNALTLSAAASSRFAVITWIQDVGAQGAGRMYLTTYRPPTVQTYTQIAAGDGHTCALTPAGRAICRGYNAYGQTRVPAGVYTAITAGEGSTCALTRAGTARCWGNFRPFRVKRVPAGSVQIDEGDGVACVLSRAGNAVCLSDKKGARTRVPAGRYKQIIVGDGYACALTRVGKISCWNLYSGPTSVVQGVPQGTFTEISGHFSTACALTRAGEAVCWGDIAREFGLDVVPAGTYAQVGAGYTHACALARAGNVVCWGRRNAAAVKEAPSGTYTQIVSGKYHACALTRSGKAVCWGSGFDPRAAF